MIWNAEENYISCLNHVINLAVQDFLKAIKGLPSVEDETPHLEEKEGGEDDDDVTSAPIKKRDSRNLILRIYEAYGGKGIAKVSTWIIL